MTILGSKKHLPRPLQCKEIIVVVGFCISKEDKKIWVRRRRREKKVKRG